MGLRARILRCVTDTGPRPRRFLSYLARSPAEEEAFETLFERMLARGELVKLGDKRGTRYGVPGNA